MVLIKGNIKKKKEWSLTGINRRKIKLFFPPPHPSRIGRVKRGKLSPPSQSYRLEAFQGKSECIFFNRAEK